MLHKYKQVNSGIAEICYICNQYIFRKTKRHETFNYNLVNNKFYCVKCIENFEESDPDWSLGLIAEESKKNE